ncbi:hypothetical protein [Maribacter aestuarii]|uniref:hypothetical protein n=1 Tax=Maribacter aestuarii TaxID=1130723 RepID=UPI0025A58F3C|nr:hypothetical protein [Maribacter aestuarii]
MAKTKYPFFYNKEPIEFISEFEKPKKGVLKCKSSYLNKTEDVELNYSSNEFTIEFQELKTIIPKGVSLLGKKINNVTFQNDTHKIILERVSMDFFTKGYINSLKSHSFNKKIKKYFKLVIPLKKELNFHFILEKFIFTNEYFLFSTEGTYIEIDKEKIFILVQGGQKKKKVSNHRIRKETIL